MLPDKVLDHVADAKTFLTSQFKGRRVVEALLSAYMRGVQTLENTFFDILTKRLLNTAIDAQLDTLGAFVDEPRDGRSNDEYRVAIRIKVKVNRSNGKAENIIEILRLCFPLAERAYEEHYPAGFIVRAIPVLAGASSARRLFGKARPPGVQATFQYSTWMTGHDFRFSSSVGSTAHTPRGYGHTSGTPLSTMISSEELVP